MEHRDTYDSGKMVSANKSAGSWLKKNRNWVASLTGAAVVTIVVYSSGFLAGQENMNETIEQQETEITELTETISQLETEVTEWEYNIQTVEQEYDEYRTRMAPYEEQAERAENGE